MRPNICLVLPAVLTLLFSGCGKKNGTETDPATAAVIASSNQEAVQAGNKEEIKRGAVETKAEQTLKVTFVELGSVKCIPCRMMQPIMDDIKKEYAGQVNVVFHDVWTPEGREHGMKYNIRVIPTQVFLDADGSEYYRHEGYFPKEELVEVLKQKGVK